MAVTAAPRFGARAGPPTPTRVRVLVLVPTVASEGSGSRVAGRGDGSVVAKVMRFRMDHAEGAVRLLAWAKAARLALR